MENHENSSKNENFRIPRQNSLIEPIVRNPFVHYLKLSRLDYLKIGLNAVILLPIRIFSVFIVFCLTYSLAFCMTFGKSDEELRAKPFSGWRKKATGVLRFYGRAIAFCFGFHKIKKNGRRATRGEAPIFVAAPHSSFLDVFVFFILGLPSGVSRSENGNIVMFGRIVKACQPILVNRVDSKNKLWTIEEIKKRSRPDSDWPQLLIFPEGTTTNRSCLISFKPGAFIPGLPVQPIVVEYKNRLDTITWTWEGLTALKVIILTLCQFNNNMEVTYLPVHVPNEAEKKDAKLFAANVRTKIADYLNVNTTNHTYEDCRLMLKARELNLPFESGLIEFEKLKEKLHITYENCQEILERFTEYAKKSNGKMSLTDFSNYLGLPATGAVVQVFNLYDRDKDNFIDFREFLIGLSLLSQPVNTEKTLKLAFNMFDRNGKGYISLSDLQSILYSAFSMPEKDVEELFKKIDTKNDGLITLDELKSYSEHRPEYSRIFLEYNEIKILQNNMEIDRLAENETNKEATQSAASSSSSQVYKRPMSDKSRPPVFEESKNKTSVNDDSLTQVEEVTKTSNTIKHNINKVD